MIIPIPIQYRWIRMIFDWFYPSSITLMAQVILWNQMRYLSDILSLLMLLWVSLMPMFRAWIVIRIILTTWDLSSIQRPSSFTLTTHTAYHTFLSHSINVKIYKDLYDRTCVVKITIVTNSYLSPFDCIK